MIKKIKVKRVKIKKITPLKSGNSFGGKRTGCK